MRPVVKPLGVGDLKVVKQRLARYEAGEIAHIENVLGRELRFRDHRRLRRLELVETVEQLREEESKRDLQSTERFELQRETQNTIRGETRLEAGLDISASYGSVQIGAFGRASSTETREESDKNSSKYAREVMEQTSARLLEKVRTTRESRTVEEVEEKNHHEFDNKASAEHVVGVYRWVDKVYRAKEFRYGTRLFYEFVVPEPAAFYLHALRADQESKLMRTPVPPKVPGTGTPLTPDRITETNYLSLVAEYDTEGVRPPPPERIVVSHSLARELPENGTFALTENDLEVPEGYVAERAEMVMYRLFGTGDFSISVAVGLKRSMETNWYYFREGLVLNGESGHVPIIGVGTNITSLATNIEVACVRTPGAYSAWQLSVYDKVMTAHRKAVAAYEEKVAAAKIQQAAYGASQSATNRQIELEQLKRGCLVIWTREQLDDASGITEDDPPEIDPTAAAEQAERMLFLEEAFEWENMTYRFYPYFWGRESTWVERQGMTSDDPLFERFLRAGAARVTVPVRPAFAGAVLYYQLTGEIWSGGPVPAFTGDDPDVPVYNGYLEDLADATDVIEPGRDVEIAAGDDETFLVRVPTTLVWLEQDTHGLPDLEAED